MASINQNYNKLPAAYFTGEIFKKTKLFLEKHPGTEIHRLGIGNTTEPLSQTIIKGLLTGVEKLANSVTYTGYGDEQGDIRLRTSLSKWYSKQEISLDPLEIFISDGAKPDTANIQSIFSPINIIAVQNPVYPVYVDSNIIAGRDIVYMPCTKENNFVPQTFPDTGDIIYLCSPNNPTGVVMTKKQLKQFVDYAIKQKAIIIFDAAYSAFIKDKDLPKSIYEIPGAKECAIEIGSFSKWAGFTGVRLGWTVVPMDLLAKDAKKGDINALWNRRQTTMFNGASNIAQEGGLAVLSEQGQKECLTIVDYYMENAALIKSSLKKIGLEVFGGDNAPYLWVKTPNGLSSWEFFDKLLAEAHVVGTPGSAFGSEGEGYFRLSAFGHREDITKAVESIEENLKL
jgi:LL-diaminopimelate aminotransferase